jgi:aminocarboxymuconate-semialdehyde decarboxylase
MSSARLLVDIHTHVYLHRYASLLRSRTSVPRILSRTNSEGKSEERLLILDDEPSGGRPVGAQVLGLLPLFESDALRLVPVLG